MKPFVLFSWIFLAPLCAKFPLFMPSSPVAVGAGSVWVTSHCDGTVSRIDPRTNSVVATIKTSYFPNWLAVGRGFAWVGVGSTEVPGSCD